MKYKPAVVVTAFNRPGSLNRILFSLSKMKNAEDVKLIISIDNKAPGNHDVLEIAKGYVWPFGEKEVIYREERLGLKKHIMLCAGLSKEYGSVIILEDDLFVSPYFYEYAVDALEYYGADPCIGGVSLYKQPIHELNLLPFVPVFDDSDVFFLQFPSSLGQAWTNGQWAAFMDWYNKHQDVESIIHKSMLGWPATSWKKFFCAYLIDTQQYFVFPRQSLSTNFNDPGTHMSRKTNHDGQTQLRLTGKPYRFKKLEDSFCKYDHLLEMEPDCVKRLNPALAGFDFEMDLYGLKELHEVKKPTIITSRQMSKFDQGFRRSLKPHEMNIISDVNGDEFFMGKTEHVLGNQRRKVKAIADFKYYYTRYIPNWKVHIYETYDKLRQRFVNRP